MKVKQVHKNIGVSIEGVDLSKIDENTFQKIKDLWVQCVYERKRHSNN